MNNQRFQTGEVQSKSATMIMNPNNNGSYLLSWNRGRTIVQASLNPQINLPIIQGQASYQTFVAFSMAFQDEDKQTRLENKILKFKCSLLQETLHHLQ